MDLFFSIEKLIRREVYQPPTSRGHGCLGIVSPEDGVEEGVLQRTRLDLQCLASAYASDEGHERANSPISVTADV